VSYNNRVHGQKRRLDVNCLNRLSVFAWQFKTEASASAFYNSNKCKKNLNFTV